MTFRQWTHGKYLKLDPNTFVSATPGDITVDLNTFRVRVHDGVTPGGRDIGQGANYSYISYVDGAIANLYANIENGAISSLNTLSELAQAIGNDAAFFTDVASNVSLINSNISLVNANLSAANAIIVTNSSNISVLQANVANLISGNIVPANVSLWDGSNLYVNLGNLKVVDNVISPRSPGRNIHLTPTTGDTNGNVIVNSMLRVKSDTGMRVGLNDDIQFVVDHANSLVQIGGTAANPQYQGNIFRFGGVISNSYLAFDGNVGQGHAALFSNPSPYFNFQVAGNMYAWNGYWTTQTYSSGYQFISPAGSTGLFHFTNINPQNDTKVTLAHDGYSAIDIYPNLTSYLNGNVRVAQDLNIQGNLTGSHVYLGNMSPLPAYQLTANTILQMTAIGSSFIQTNIVNSTKGFNSTADIVATNDIGSDSQGYVDLGIASSAYVGNLDGFTVAKANDAYLYSLGNITTGNDGNLVVGAANPNAHFSIFAGGITDANVMITANGATGNVSLLNNSNLYVTGSTWHKGNVYANGGLLTNSLSVIQSATGSQNAVSMVGQGIGDQMALITSSTVGQNTLISRTYNNSAYADFNITAANVNLNLVNGVPGLVADKTGNLYVKTSGKGMIFSDGSFQSTAGIYSNTNAAAYLTTYGGNIAAGNVTISGNLNVTGNINALSYEVVSITEYANNFTASGNVNAGNLITTNGLYYSNGVNVISAAGVYSNSNVIGYLSGNITVGNIAIGNMRWSSSDQTISTTNGSSMTIASRLNLTGNAAGLGLTVTSPASFSSTVTMSNATSTYGYFWGNGVAYGTSNYSNTNVGYYLNSNVITSNISILGNVTANTYYGNSFLYSNGISIVSSYSNTNVGYYLNSNVITSNITLQGNVNTIANVSLGNLVISSSGFAYGNAANASSASSATSLGYLGLPQNSQSGSSYAVVIGDAGKHLFFTAATVTATIPANASVPFPIGSTIAFIANAGTTLTVAITSDTMYLGGTGTTGSRTLAAYGMATAVKVASTTWFISGVGLT
jgi:hypothetical protein